MATCDDELVRRWQGGDSGAFAELVRLPRRGVYRVAYAVLGGADERPAGSLALGRRRRL
jgi:hypothetical protein